ncbi:MAG TPA: PDZ domain-containing protein [Pyrinomonadaceae bacterium]|jgi:predicted metalloprotease with PDZ domain|nr:PDZ domain-containing protein [Pyrinomonadaceae bacterium]
MRYTRAHALAVAALLFFFCAAAATTAPARARNDTRPATSAAAAAQATTPAPAISYTVSMPQPSTHLLEVEMRLRWAGAAAAPVRADLVMPVWTPGSYLVREYARHVQDFAAQDGGGRALGWRKVNKNTWRVETGGARELVARYSVYANELTVRTNELNDRHAFWNNAALLMYPEGHLSAPSVVRVQPYKDWKIATGLPAVSGERNTFRAENFDTLYDSPFLASDFRVVQFEARNVPHRIVIDGEGNYDPERLRRDVQKIVEQGIEMMRDVPYTNYTFLLMTHPTGNGGLEHLNSTALIYPRFRFRPDADYRSFLTLAAHEYFHLWNVKRIRPDALGPFDYTGENYTRLLWVAEGITSYYEEILTRRAGLMTDKDYLASTASAFQALQNTPGRLEMSAEEASFDAWIKYYRPDENTINSAISYYDKGGILGLLLDLEIRKRSGGARSLDDVMRYLYAEFYRKNRNYTPEDFQRAAEVVAGASLDDFFRRYVRGREELDYNAGLEVVGLRLDTTGGAADTGKVPVEKAYLGATLAQEGDRLVVRNVPAGTPAYNQGLSAGDQIVSVDGIRATRDFLNARIDEKRPGDTVTLSVFRLDELRTFQIKLGGRVDAPFRIVPVRQPSAEQMKNYQNWLGAPFPKAG